MFSSYFHTLFRKYASGKGCAGRKEYWSFLFLSLLLFILMILGTAPFFILVNLVITTICGGFLFLGFLITLLCVLIAFLLFFALPWSALCIRRLHDIGLTGWLVLIMLIPGCFTITTVVLGLIPGSENNNPYSERL